MPDSLRLSRHAIEQFHIRVRPALTPDQAKVELQRLAHIGRPVQTVDWHEPDAEDPPDYYLELSDGIALVVCGNTALTCIARGTSSPEYRKYRTRRHKRRKARSQARKRQQDFDSKHARYGRDKTDWAA